MTRHKRCLGAGAWGRRYGAIRSHGGDFAGGADRRVRVGINLWHHCYPSPTSQRDGVSLGQEQIYTHPGE
ncbi:hypothetical protein C7212DRAFT_321871 [Tuber magnatum]|uniref:Uncharacterized protein n=1 Tax=Tuber magnatum TaxID=42249 RepID=A0A317SPF2_9PEZI|nr:hypothetical protein C7212DRAFT_321871 [Tuber magnatum]